MSFKSILGQSQPKKILTNALQNSSIAHAYLFYGQESINSKILERGQSDQVKLWISDKLLHLNEGGDGFAAINDAVVVSQHEVHHRPDDKLAVHGNPEMIVPTN